jgi:hypothetical protein
MKGGSIGCGATGEMLIHRLSLTTAKIRALGAISRKSVEVRTPEGYRLFMVRSAVSALFAFVDDVGGTAKLQARVVLDGESLAPPVAIDVVHGPESTPADAGSLVTAAYLMRQMDAGTAPTGFELRSINAIDDSDGPTFATLNEAFEGDALFEIFFLPSAVLEVSL